MPLNEITISGQHRGKTCTVTFTRSNKAWRAEILIDSELHERITNEKPCMVTAQRLVDQIILPPSHKKSRFQRKPAGREIKLRLFGSDE